MAMIEKTLQSFDGTRLVYQVWGTEGPAEEAARRRWLVIANGYGGTFCALRDLLGWLDRYRVLLWDYRGLHRSGIPADRSRLRIEDHCLDLELLLEAEGISRMVLGGWSVGVQVALEQYRRHPEGIDALLLLNGAHGKVLRRSFDGKLAALLLSPSLASLRALAPLLTPLILPPLRVASRSPLSLRVASLLGIVHGKPASFHEALQAVLTLDYPTYLQMVLHADEHDTEDLLQAVAVPTLVTAGDRDLITPPRIGRGIAARIPGAEYFEIPGGTHYSVMEFPRLLANRIESFVRARLDHPPIGS
jgi:pimeloyl-ACP methyl ester carboxylesterase